MRSIRSRTLALVLGLLAAGLSAISLVSYRDARHEIEELFDAELAQQARLLAGMIPAGMAPAARLALQQALDEAVVGTAAAGEGEGAGVGEGDEARLQGHEYESKLGFVVFDDQGDSLLRSASAPVAALERLLGASSAAPAITSHTAPPNPPPNAPSAGAAGAAPPPAAPRRLGAHLAGYHTVAMDDGDWRLFVLRDGRDRQWIVVGERQDVRGELVGRITLRSLLPDVIGLPLLALLVWLAIGWGLRPLARVAQPGAQVLDQVGAAEGTALASGQIGGLRGLQHLLEHRQVARRQAGRARGLAPAPHHQRRGRLAGLPGLEQGRQRRVGVHAAPTGSVRASSQARASPCTRGSRRSRTIAW